MTEHAWWMNVAGADLAQGDYLPSCPVPCFMPSPGSASESHSVLVKEYDCIVLTQSCDLENEKAPFVALCPAQTVAEFEADNPISRHQWESVRRGRVEGLHLLGALETKATNRNCLVVVFREIYSLPIEFVRDHASGLDLRRRLCSPYLEHFSQAFARFFMRVGLPTGIPPFK